MPKKVLVPIADGSEELESVTVIDVLRRAGIDVTVASVGSTKQVVASRGVNLAADVLIADCKQQVFDLIALPGGMPGAEYLRDSAELTEMLKAQAEAGRFYAAICAASVIVLQHHGLLAGRKATCYPSLAPQLVNGEAADQKVVIDKNCITSQGPGTALAFALKLVEMLLGSDKAEHIAKEMLV
jgi:4-methyl-5(b-hydroxyethyl)-thiazole monophosphate biosynthesis